MKLKYIKKSTMVLALSASFILPQTPNAVLAQDRPAHFPIDLFPIDSGDGDTGLFPTDPIIPISNGTTNGSNTGTSNNGSGSGIGIIIGGQPVIGNTNGRQQGNGKTTMLPARVPEPYSCPLFDNRPNSELFLAIDALDKEISTSPKCTGTPSARTLEDNGTTIKNSISAIEGLLQNQDPSSITAGQIDQSVTAAITAVGNIGDVINNNNFLNSECGTQTMSSGKVLLALNDVINGLAPYALLAVSMNASLHPALPYVIGGAVVTSGISAISKLIDSGTLVMTNPVHRKALLQNTCQFMKIAKKVRFMQLAQSGKIESITKELERNVDFYNAKFSIPTQELSSLIAYRDTKKKATQSIENQMIKDQNDLNTINTQIEQNNDDLMICTLSSELANWAKNGNSFPASAFLNLEAAVDQGDRTQKLQALSLKSLHEASLKKIDAYAPKASENDSYLKACAQAGRSWLAGIRQSLNVTSTILNKNKADLEAELSKNPEYRQWIGQYNRIRSEKITIKRVEKAMEELAKDDSIIDRSELAQRVADLKAGLFGSRNYWSAGKPPVQAWIDHTKNMHDQAIASLTKELNSLVETYKATTPGRSLKIDSRWIDKDGVLVAGVLNDLNAKTLKPGTADNERICQQLDSSWLNWSAALSHLGAIQFFCDMIDPVLDANTDADIVKTCRDNIKSSGKVISKSIVSSAKDVLIRKGFRDQAGLISQKLKDLQCPMPSVSVMNN